MSATVALPLEPSGGWLPDGSRLTWLNAPSGKKEAGSRSAPPSTTRSWPAAAGREVSETCTVITTLLDHGAAPADQVRDTYLTRWSASETTFGEDKATIARAGDRTSGPVLRSGVPRLVISEAWAWLTATQLVRASAAAALRSETAAARALRRQSHALATADEELLHRRLAPRGPLHDIIPGHRLIVAGSARRRSRGRRPRRPAHPERPRAAAQLRTRPESPPEIPARHRDQADCHRETAGHRIRARLLITRGSSLGTISPWRSFIFSRNT